MAWRMSLGTAVVLAAASAFGADQSTSASCTAPLPVGAVELGSAERSERTVLLRFEGLGVVAPDLAAYQLLARCASRSNGDLTLRASAPVDAALFTQAVQRIAELVRVAVAEGQPNARMSVEIVTRADRQQIIEVQVSMTVPRVVEPPPQAQRDPAKDPRIAWDRAQRYEERLAAQKQKEAQAKAALSAREAAAEQAREELEERAARARFDARERARALAAQARRSEQERMAAQEAAARAEEERKALDERIVLREQRLEKGRAERKAREERARVLDEAVAKAMAEDRATRARNDGSWVQPVARRDLIGLPLPAQRGEGRGEGPTEPTKPRASAPADEAPMKAKEDEPAPPLEREEPEPTAEVTAEKPEPKKPVERAEPEPTPEVVAEKAEPKPVERAEPEPTPDVVAEKAEPKKPIERAEPEPTPEVVAGETESAKPVEDEKPARATEVEAVKPHEKPVELAVVEKSAHPLPDPLPQGGEGDKVKDALEPLKLAMLAYDQELKLKARKDAEAERVAAARQAALEERQAALAEKASKLKAGKLPAVGAEEKEFAREERERLAEEKRLQAAALALAQKERKQAAEEARLAERARKLKERELTGRDDKAIDAARTARLELEAAAERSRKEQEALAAERLQADEQAMAAREARLTALSKRVELATVKSETLLPGAAGRKQITTALAQTTRDIQRCVEAHLKRFPIAGKTQGVLVLSIDLRGRVSGSGIAEGPLKGSFVESCLRDAAKSWRFPSSDSDFELEVPLTLVGH